MTPSTKITIRARALAAWLLPLIAALWISHPAVAQSLPLACGQPLSAPVLTKWTQMGGADGVLGCPTGPEWAGADSPDGDTAHEADFPNGMIIWHANGPRAGQTYAVTGCAWRLYFQYGGPSGWLGLPISDPVNTPDGQRQAFEGGQITDQRALGGCSAERAQTVNSTSTAEPPPKTVATSPLDLFFDPARDDHLSAASATSVQRALAAHYQRIEGQAHVFDSAVAGATGLKLFWNAAHGDHMTVATAEGARDALDKGYEFEASQGFVWTDPRPGALTLKLYSDGVHHWLTASPAEEADAVAHGFKFVRIEGYAPAA